MQRWSALARPACCPYLHPMHVTPFYRHVRCCRVWRFFTAVQLAQHDVRGAGTRQGKDSEGKRSSRQGDVVVYEKTGVVANLLSQLAVHRAAPTGLYASADLQRCLLQHRKKKCGGSES